MIIRASFFILAIVSAVKISRSQSSSRESSTSEDAENEKASSQQEEIEEKNGKFEESKIEAMEKEGKQAKPTRPDDGEIYFLNSIVDEKVKESGDFDVRLLELYCLKEQESRVALLQKQLINKISEIDRLRWEIDELNTDKGKLHEELKMNQLAEKQLETAKLKISGLEEKRKLDAIQMEGQLVQLREQISGICVQAEAEQRRGRKIKDDQKLKALKDVEMKANKMKIKNIELQLDKRELVFKLDAAKAQMDQLSSTTEHKMVAEFREELCQLKQANNNLVEEIDMLQRDRFSFLEELVYQRWLNTCLRFEAEEYHNPRLKKIRPIERNNSNLWSQSNSSEGVSSIDFSDDFSNNSTISSSSSDDHVKEKKRGGLFRSIKRWTRRRDNSNGNALESKTKQSNPGRIRRYSTSSIPSSRLGLRSRGPALFPSENEGKLDFNSPEKPALPRVRRVSFNDSINSIRYIYEEIPTPPDNSQEILSESFNDCPAMETSSALVKMETSTAKGDTKMEENKAECPEEVKHQAHPGTETLTVRSIQLDQEETMSPGSGDSLVNLTVVLFLLILFVVLFYFGFI